MVELHSSLNLRELCRSLLIADIRLRVKNIEHSLGSRYIGDYLIIEVSQISDRTPEH